jgi:tetratricopeptide (TPR) repeat protein
LREQEEVQRRKTTGDLLLAETRWRLSHSELAGRLAHYTDGASERRYEHWRKHNRELADALVDHGRWFSEREDWQRAYDYLDNARALHADAVPDTLLTRVRERHEALSQRSRARREQRQRQQAREQREQARSLLDQYRDSGKLEVLLQLRELIQQHRRHLPEQLTAKVEILSRERFRTAVNEGDARYARGDYREARTIWERIKPLAPPDSELPEKLERVERVLDKLQNLERSKN